MFLTPGTRLGVYEVLAPLGKGGMGEVWLARDTKLDREVALKTLPAEFAADPDRLARFEREAKLLASLNHPNIGTIYGFEESGATRFLVLELVEGETLADRLQRGAMPVEEAVQLALQIAEALEAAHEKGVIHRDLKPANIKVTPDETVKVLDFGLAKAMEPAEGSSPAVSQSPTITAPAHTMQGVILGTAAYMSPEQARGRPVDKRADIWAFGCVLFEMLTAQPAFSGDEMSDVLASVLAKEPAFETVPSVVPDRVRQSLKACLQKDPRQRMHDIADVRLALEGVFATSALDTVLPKPAPRPRALLAVAFATGIAGVLVAAWALSPWGGRTPPPRPTTRVSVMVPANRPVPDSICFPCQVLSISSDGTQLVYVGENLDMPPGAPGARWQLQLRSLTTLGVRDLPGTAGASQPFFSPDGQWVAFFTGTGRLEKVSVSGGDPVRLVEGLNGSRWASGVWTEDGTIVFERAGSLVSVSAEGGEPTVLTTPDESADEAYHRSPALVTGSRAVLFTVGYRHSKQPQVAAVTRDSGERRVVVENAYGARALASGHLLFQRGEAILVAPFDRDLLRVTGPAIPLVDAVRFDNAARSTMPLAQLAVSRDGTLAYLPLADRLGTLGLVARDGRFEPLGLPPSYAETPRVAPDGSAVAFVEARGSESEVRVHDLVRGSTTNVGPPGRVRWLAWNPGARSLAVMSRDDGGIVSRKLDGPEELLVPTPTDAALRDFSWSPDGMRLAYTVQNGSQYDIWVMTFGKAPAQAPFLESSAEEYGPAFSPDGRWLAYGSDESGRGEVYIRRYPSGERFAVSTGGGFGPVWRPDGREIYYQGASEGTEKLFAVTVTADGERLRLGAPVPLFDLRPPSLTGVVEEYVSSSISGISYDILPDGNRFLMVKRAAERGGREIVLVQDWFEELRRLVPAK